MAEKQKLNVGHVAARLLAVTLPMGLTLDEIIIQGENLLIESEPVSFNLGTPGTLDIRISESSLGEFLNHKAPGGLSGFKVKLADGHIHVEAKASMIITINVGAVCKLRIEDGTKLYVDLVRMEAIGGTGAYNLVQRQLDNINPVLDTADLPVSAELTRVEIENQWLVLHGTIAPRA